MTFVWHEVLWLALVGPMLTAANLWLSARGRDRGDAPLRVYPRIRRGQAAGGRVRFETAALRRSGSAWRLSATLVLVVVALARPQWGSLDEAPSPDAPGEVIIALDLSRSMLAKDVAPSRLEVARSLAGRLADDLVDRRVGLIGFAGSAHILAPPSDDRAVLRAYLPKMRPDHMPNPGTSLANLIDVAAGAFGPENQGRTLVVLSDGEAAPESWEGRLGGLQARHVHVVAVGIGTEGGGKIAGAGGRALLSPQGAPVVTRLNPAALQALASATGGRYLDVTRAGELVEAVRAANVRPAGDGQRGRVPGRAAAAEQFGWFVGLALGLLAWSAVAEFKASPRLGRQRTPVAAQAAIAACLLFGLLPPASRAARPLLTETDLQGEKDPLQHMREVVAGLVRKGELSAPDYLQVAEVAARYGEIHRGHGHALQDGVLRDGLAAVARGRRTDPGLTDWGRLEAKLNRLLVPPPLVPPDPGSPDPANEPTGAQGEAPIAGEDARDSSAETGPKGEKQPTAGEQGLQNVGGTERDMFSAAEWSNPALVQTLDQLQRVKAADSPAELFARSHPSPRRPPTGGQSW